MSSVTQDEETDARAAHVYAGSRRHGPEFLGPARRRRGARARRTQGGASAGETASAALPNFKKSRRVDMIFSLSSDFAQPITFQSASQRRHRGAKNTLL